MGDPVADGIAGVGAVGGGAGESVLSCSSERVDVRGKGFMTENLPDSEIDNLPHSYFFELDLDDFDFDDLQDFELFLLLELFLLFLALLWLFGPK